MKTVWKYSIPVDDRDHPLPVRVVHVGPDSTALTILTVWAEVDVSDSPTVPTAPYRVFGTGHPIPDEAEHVGSVPVGPFVWHLYRLVAS